jgi:hypothetical protein
MEGKRMAEHLTVNAANDGLTVEVLMEAVRLAGAAVQPLPWADREPIQLMANAILADDGRYFTMDTRPMMGAEGSRMVVMHPNVRDRIRAELRSIVHHERDVPGFVGFAVQALQADEELARLLWWLADAKGKK